MSPSPEDPRTERILEGAFGALGDWLELVRRHEQERRVKLAALERARRDQVTRIVMAVLSAAILVAFHRLTGR
jgi:hypothetical protein